MLSLATEVSEEDCLPLASIRWTWAEVCQSPSLRPLIATIIFIHINYAVTLRVVARPPWPPTHIAVALSWLGVISPLRFIFAILIQFHYHRVLPMTGYVPPSQVFGVDCACLEGGGGSIRHSSNRLQLLSP